MAWGAVGNNSLVSKLKNQCIALRLDVQIQCERSNRRVLIGQGISRFQFVRCDEIKTLEVKNVAPPTRYLAVSNAQRTCWETRGQLGDGALAKDAIAKIAEYYHVGTVLS